MDRSYQEVLSVSPLKYRVQLDVYGEGANNIEEEEVKKTPNKTSGMFLSPSKLKSSSSSKSMLKRSTIASTTAFKTPSKAGPSASKSTDLFQTEKP